MPKRIIVVASTFPASDTDSVPAFVRDQIIAMKTADSSIDFDVLAPHDRRSNTANYTRHSSYSEHRFHYAWPHRFEQLAGRGIMPALKQNRLNYLLIPCLFIGESIALFKLVRRLRPDYIYAHWFTPQGVVASIIGRLTHTSYVFTTHASDVDVWHKIPVIGRPVVRWSTKSSTAITAVSRRSLAKLQSFFSQDEWQRDYEAKSSIIPMGVDINTVDAIDDVVDLKLKYDLVDKTVLFFMGRLAEKKGVSYLLQAVKKLDRDNAVLVIAGDGPLRTQLESEVYNLGLNAQVRFVGYVSGEQKRDYLELADLVILPSIIASDGDAEGLPVVFMEALAAGKLCIATNESGADDIIKDGVSGFLIPQRDVNFLESAIYKALNLTSLEAEAIRKNAREVASQFDWSSVARRHLDFFESRLN